MTFFRSLSQTQSLADSHSHYSICVVPQRSNDLFLLAVQLALQILNSN